ncbi:MAG: hypothetical protein BA862_10180 [Desulfobulbaceae bacterium S3730MH12]|nr:MAG: hypothetical protein BA866_03155 [Desulfobulbaceae bacterium S5133MH15]OEU56255.1 MAG: hypothetical protein BA862_10180 [Desulfobulbaceae bacterium S3730MH12]OEU83440.1 MAG: hypothetical protein BA873_07195 [Desulfobulbaceae bacterium C00003063]
MRDISRTYYLFLGFHGFLLGLFPFFLPVYLYKNGSPLSEIALFIALSGLGFIITLWGWDRLRSNLFRRMIIASLLLELSVVLSVYFAVDLTIVALLNGGYNCLYWMIQRILFFSAVSPENSGQKFGNFQIFVLVVLKAGIFVGSILLGGFGLIAICILSLIVVCVAILLFSYRAADFLEIPAPLQQRPPIRISDLISFKDRYYSRLIFAVDGVFLYLESYFWLISLFLLVGESFVKLGLVVIGLALFLGVLFFLIKNRIDRLQVQKVYRVAVLLYALSWVMRGSITSDMSYSLQMCMIVLIGFSTSFFRLAFNKRFFDLAGLSIGYDYIFFKSYYSQFFLACTLLLFAVILQAYAKSVELLPFIYWVAAGLTFIYLKYSIK